MNHKKLEKPIHQKLLVGIGLVISGIVGLGGLLDAVSNSLSLIDTKVAYIVTVLIFVIWGVIELWTRKYGISWLTMNKEFVRITRVGWHLRLPIMGVIILLWFPTLIKLWHYPKETKVETATASNTPLNQADAKRLSVLIAEFKGPNPEQYGITEILKKGLEDLRSKYIDLRVEYLSEVLDNKDTAEHRGRELNANIVIWGNYLANPSHAQVTANFTMPYGPSYLPITTDETTIRSSIAQLRAFAIQDTLSNRMRYLVLVASALTFYVGGDYAQAVKRFDSAITEAKNHSDSYISYFYRGTAQGFSGKHQAAVDDLTRCIRLRPRMVEAFNNLGIAYAGIDKHGQAIEAFRKAIKIKPDHVNAHINLGGEYFDKGEYKQASDEFSKAIKYDPNDLRALVLLAEANYELGNDEVAISTLNQASKLGEDGQYYSLLGALYLRRGNFALAVLNFQKALALQLESGVAHQNLARAYAEQGNSQQAVSHYTKAIESQPNADLYHDRALANYTTGRANEAAADFRKAIELDAKLADAYFGLSYAYLLLEQGGLAAEAADHYVRLNGWHESRSKYMALVIYFGLRQSDKPEEAQQILKKATQRCEKSVWPCPIVNYLRRGVTLPDVLKEAHKAEQIGTGITATKKRIGVYGAPDPRLPTEAHTYIALDLALTAKISEAYAHLQWVHDYGERRSFEYQLARSKLEQLKK